jgi:hypothetical protein
LSGKIPHHDPGVEVAYKLGLIPSCMNGYSTSEEAKNGSVHYSAQQSVDEALRAITQVTHVKASTFVGLCKTHHLVHLSNLN